MRSTSGGGSAVGHGGPMTSRSAEGAIWRANLNVPYIAIDSRVGSTLMSLRDPKNTTSRSLGLTALTVRSSNTLPRLPRVQ